MKKRGSYPRNISIIATVFIFLILFLALVNLYFSIQMRNEFMNYDRDKVLSIASLYTAYQSRFSEKNELAFLLRNLSRAFNFEHLVISDTLGNRIYDSWSMPSDLGYLANKVDYHRLVKNLPEPGQIVRVSDHFLYLNPAPTFYVYAAMNPSYAVLFDRIFTWYIFYITISLVFVSFLGVFLIRNLFLPMRYVANVAKDLGVEMKKEDFVSETFNEIFHKIRIKEQLLMEFSSYIAHEFRNSIGAIAGLARLVEKGKKPAADVVKECQAMEELINNLLEYSRPIKPDLLPVDVKSLIDDATTRALIPERIDFTKNIKPDLPKIKGDYDLLQVAVTNLLKNSIEAIEGAGKIQIEASSDEDFVMISINDTGCGFDTQEIDKIFSPFYSKKETGMGLGLAYVKKIMEIHNGLIEVKSRRNAGSQFTLKFFYRE